MEATAMTALRKSARAGEARKKALEKASAFEARHQSLVKLSEKYFEAEGRIEDIRDDLEDEIAKLRKDAASRIDALRDGLKSTVQAMLDTKEPKGHVAQRLGLSSAALGKLVAKIHPTPATGPAAPTEETVAPAEETDNG